MEQKSHENNKLRQACADIEKAMQDLYRSRKGPGSLQIEMDSLKIDNDCLLQLLKETCEYADFSNEDIMKAAATSRAIGSKGLSKIGDATGRRAKSARAEMDNNWIPTKAVETLTAVQKKHKGQLNERAVSEILSGLNMIWRNIMRQEVEAQKTKMSLQI